VSEGERGASGQARRGFSAHAAATPGRAALVLGDRTLTYGELDRRSGSVALALRGLGVDGGDRVAVMLPNGLELFECALALAKLDAALVPVNWHLKADELTWILTDSAAAVLVTDAAIWDSVSAAGARVPGCRVVVVGGPPAPASTVDYEGLVAGPVGGADGEVLDAGAGPSLVFYTSGTTGRPKGVVHGARGAAAAGPPRTGSAAGAGRARLAAAQDGQVALWRWTDEDVHLLSGPGYHAGPCGWTLTALYAGATTVILPAWDARRWLELVERHRVTRSFMVPSHFVRILELPERERRQRDLSSLRLIVHAAAPCPTGVKRRIIEELPTAEIWELYGASEGGATRISPQEWLARPGSVGLPWPGVGVKILDEEGRELPPDRTGLVYVVPPGGAGFHYHNDTDKTASAWRGDAFTVGDVGHLDEDGYLFITDRASDMVIRGGVNVYPREAEDALYAHPGVVDCTVFGVPDPVLGERLKAMVELRDTGVTAEDLLAHCRDRLAGFKCPEIVELVDTLPRDPNGKVLKRLLRDAHWGGTRTAISTE